MSNRLEETLKIILDKKYDGDIKSYFAKARDAGMPMDQVKFFLSVGYIPVPSMLPFHAAARRIDTDDDAPNNILTGGARGGAKSHSAMMQVADDCNRIEGWNVLFLRKTIKAARLSMEQLIDRTLKYCKHTWFPSGNKINFPNGSTVVMGGYNNETDIDAYLSLEYDGISIEELSTLSEKKTEKIYGSIRTSKPGRRTHKYHTTNPGGIGHRYVKEHYILPYRKGVESETRFYPSSYRDNPFLDADYVKWLEGLRGSLGKAWREGDWDVFEGQAFAFNYDKHVVNIGFEIPEHWTRFRAIDWGSNAPFCCLWGAMNPDNGRYVIYRELYVDKEQGDIPLTDPQQAMRILSMSPVHEKIAVTYCDPSMFKKKSAEAGSDTASVYAANKLYLTAGDNDRINGKRRIDRLLADLPDGQPGLQIMENCPNLITQLSDLVFKEGTEDVGDNQEDHAYDTVRYLTSGAVATSVVYQPKKKKFSLSPFEIMLGVKHG